MSKQFPLAQILTITTGRLLCPIDGVYEILNHITGDSLFTHVLPRAGKFAKPILLEAYPELAAAGTDAAQTLLDEYVAIAKQHGGDRDKIMEACATWIGEMKEQHGLKDSYEVQSHDDSWMSLNPIEELQGMIGKEKVVTIAVK